MNVRNDAPNELTLEAPMNSTVSFDADTAFYDRQERALNYVRQRARERQQRKAEQTVMVLIFVAAVAAGTAGAAIASMFLTNV